jgi:hypothetical protein
MVRQTFLGLKSIAFNKSSKITACLETIPLFGKEERDIDSREKDFYNLL